MLRLLIGLLIVSAAVGGADEPNPSEGALMQDVHARLSAACFNECWNYLDKAERTAEDTENMILLAYASLWHWTQRTDCQPMNLSVGYWQVSRVHAEAGQPPMARHFGERCLQVSEDNSLPPFYVGYAREALARADALSGSSDSAGAHLAEADSQAALITDPDEKALLIADLDAVRTLLHGMR